MNKRWWWKVGAAVAVVAIGREVNKQIGWDKESAIRVFGEWSDRLGIWSIPLYIFGASLSFWIGRLVFKRSSSAMKWAQGNKYFHVLSKGVERDGWKFVLLARFSPMPSYVINYALAATNVGFILDFLLPTVIGCVPMILQNTSIGSLAGAAVSSTSDTHKSKLWSYIFPLLGIVSSILISMRIKKYSTDISIVEMSPNDYTSDSNRDDSSQTLSGKTSGENLKKRQ
ncbi:SNARE associated Golgi protein family [Euphorbia peplus]|nr:SNARE associated Golgi protein family [Euphorbia peplus]